jgi:hypothetical protein
VVVRYGFAAEHELAKAVDFYERERVEETCLQYGPMSAVALRNWCQAPNR